MPLLWEVVRHILTGLVAHSDLRGFWENVRPFISRLRFFVVVVVVVGSGDQLAHTNFTLQARISPQWLSELRRQWPNVPGQVACELVSGWVPTLCLDSGTVSPLRLRWVKGVGVFRCNLPPALLAV